MIEKGFTEDIPATLPKIDDLAQTHGTHDGTGMSLGIAVSRYNEVLTHGLLDACLSAVEATGVKREDIQVYWVPGAYEIPAVVQQIAAVENQPDAVVALGAVIEGQTNHADVISREVASALNKISREQGVPVIDTVVTVRSMDQAEKRCLGGRESRGWYAGLAAVEMANLFRKLKG